MKRHWKLILSTVLFFAIVGGTLGLLQGRAESAVRLQTEALDAIADMGPVRVVAIDEIYGDDGVSHKAQIIQLLDKNAGRERETVLDANTGETLTDRSVIGNDVTSVDHKVSYVSHYSGLEPPASLLTLWGGYEDLLREGKPVEVPDSSDGLHHLVVAVDDLTITAHLGTDYMPLRLEFDEAGAARSPSRVIAYESIEAIEGVSVDQVRINSLPSDPVVVESHRVLPTDNPRITESVPFGQYWLGSNPLGRTLVSAEHLQFSPRPDYEPAGINGLLLIYQAEGGTTRDKNKDIQLTCHPLKGDVAETDLASYETKTAEPDYELWQRFVAGQQTQVLVRTLSGDSARVIQALVFLQDAVLEVNGNVSLEELEKLLSALTPLA